MKFNFPDVRMGFYSAINQREVQIYLHNIHTCRSSAHILAHTHSQALVCSVSKRVLLWEKVANSV